MKLVYKDDQVRLLDQDKCRTLSVDVRGDVDLDAIEDLRKLLGRAEMLMRGSLIMEPCPACEQEDMTMKRVGTFYEVRCSCGMCGHKGRTVNEAVGSWNRTSKELRERRKKE